MAEQEVSKHTKQIFKLLANNSHGIWHKTRELLFEIIIIIFAVSISIWLHGIGEHHHEQEQVKSFLLGLKVDIQTDIDQLNDIVSDHQMADEKYRYLAELTPAEPINEQKFDAAYQNIFSSWAFEPETSRFEGFKSGGKLTNIENEELLEKILKYYQTSWPIGPEKNWIYHREKLHAYLETADETIESRLVQFRLLTSTKGKYLIRSAVTNDELYSRYRSFAEQGRQIIRAIDLAYPASEPAQREK